MPLLLHLDTAVQADDKDAHGARMDHPEDHEVLDVLTLGLGVAPLAPMTIFNPGLEAPYLIRQQMTTFPQVLRVPPVAWACQSILTIYLDKIEQDDLRRAAGLEKLSLPLHVYDYFHRVLGLSTAADVHVAQLIKACETHINKQPRVSLFASQIGLLRKEEMPSMDVRDTEFILQVLRLLQRHGELQSEMTKVMHQKTRLNNLHNNQNSSHNSTTLLANNAANSSSTANNNAGASSQAVTTTTTAQSAGQGPHNSNSSASANASSNNNNSNLPSHIAHVAVHIRPEIARNVGAAITQHIFEKWLPDGGEDFIIKVKSMQQSGGELGAKYIDLDLFLETLIEPWHLVRWTWEEHGRFLFKQHCGVYRVLQEATFANDEGVQATDTVLAEMSRSVTFDCIRRPLRLFQAEEAAVRSNPNDDDGKGGKGGGGGKGGRGSNGNKMGEGNPNKEPVCEMINRRKFTEVMRIINPSLPFKVVRAFPLLSSRSL